MIPKHPYHPMKCENCQCSTGDKEFIKKSTLYREFLAELEEILRHKWIESEKVGHDIGFERALLDWNRNHRCEWRTARKPNHSRHEYL